MTFTSKTSHYFKISIQALCKTKGSRCLSTWQPRHCQVTPTTHGFRAASVLARSQTSIHLSCAYINIFICLFFPRLVITIFFFYHVLCTNLFSLFICFLVRPFSSLIFLALVPWHPKNPLSSFCQQCSKHVLKANRPFLLSPFMPRSPGASAPH